MDPLSAVIGAVLIATFIMLGSWEAGTDQARAEARTAREAIITDLAARRTRAAARLRDRLEAGHRAGPAAGMWWAWAAVRSAGAIRRAARRPRRPAEGRRRRLTGPAGRILGAAWRGARHGWRRARGERAADQRRPAWVPVGVCERCGVVAAATALAGALTRYGLAAIMCAACRAEEEAARQADQAGPDPDADLDPADVVNAELVDEPVAAADLAGITTGPLRCGGCAQPLDVSGCANPACRLSPGYQWPPGTIGAPQEAATRWRLPVRSCPLCGRQLLPSTWWAVRATNADICLWCANGYFSSTQGRVPPRLPIGACRERAQAEMAAISDPVDGQGKPLPPGPGLYGPLGQLAADQARAGAATSPPPESPAGSRETASAVPAPAPEGRDDMTCVTGEVHTQAAWANQASAISGQLAGIGGSTENMLASLSAVNAGREHIRAAAQWADQVRAVLGYGTNLVTDVNRRQDPYVGAVQAAGGSAEVADPGYYREM